MFFQSYEYLGHIVFSAIAAYLCVLAFIRLLGKRSTSKMNNYDWLITLAVASIFASIVVSKSVPLVEGLSAIFTLLLLQYGLTWLSSRSKRFSGWVQSSPTLLVYKGELLHSAMKRERVTEREILAKMRESGVCNIEDVDIVVLESDGEMSVVCCGDDMDLDDGAIMKHLSRGSS